MGNYWNVLLKLWDIGIRGIFTRNGRYELRKIGNFIHSEKKTINESAFVKLVNVSDIVQKHTQLQIHDLEHKDGNTSVLEYFVLGLLACKYNPKRIFEIGTFDGRTTTNFAANTSDSTEIFTLDLPKSKLGQTAMPIHQWEECYVDKEKSGKRFEGDKLKKKIVQLYGDSASFDYSPFINSCDFVFIDGSHMYEYVINDTNMALKLLKPEGGVIIWHDFSSEWDGNVPSALHTFVLKDRRFKKICRIQDTSLALLEI